jgi:hypothetical protein
MLDQNTLRGWGIAFNAMEQNLLFARRGLSNPRLAGGFVNPPGATWKATFAVLPFNPLWPPANTLSTHR